MALLSAFVSPFGVWSGFRTPEPSDWRMAATSAPCPAIAVQNLTPAQAATILEAATAVCETMADPRFAHQVRAESEWVADCTPNGMPRTRISDDEVLAAINPPRIGFSVVAKKPWRAVAVTNLNYMGIAIRKQRFEAWQSGRRERQAEMVETLAHEMTHLVPETQGSTASLFKDENHVESERDPARCLNSKLVSYDIGRIVRELWLVRLSSGT